MKNPNVLKSCLIHGRLALILKGKRSEGVMKSTGSFRLRMALVGVLVFVGLALFVGSLLAAEYLVNGGFESGMSGWTTLSEVYSETGGFVIEDSSGCAHTGLTGIFISTTAAGAGVYQVFTVTEPEVPLSVTAWYSSPFPFGEENGGVFGVFGPDLGNLCDTYFSTPSEWISVSCNFTPTSSGTHTIRFISWSSYDTLNLCLDDISVSDGVSAPAPTPTLAPTSQWTVITGTLPSGNVYAVEYRVTAGDVFVGVVAFIFLVIAIVVRKL